MGGTCFWRRVSVRWEGGGETVKGVSPGGGGETRSAPTKTLKPPPPGTDVRGREVRRTSVALREQARLKALVVDRDTEAWQRDAAFLGLQRVGGVDVSFVKGDSISACASLVVLSYPELEVTPRGRPALAGAPGQGPVPA